MNIKPQYLTSNSDLNKAALRWLRNGMPRPFRPLPVRLPVWGFLILFCRNHGGPKGHRFELRSTRRMDWSHYCLLSPINLTPSPKNCEVVNSNPKLERRADDRDRSVMGANAPPRARYTASWLSSTYCGSLKTAWARPCLRRQLLR